MLRLEEIEKMISPKNVPTPTFDKNRYVTM